MRNYNKIEDKKVLKINLVSLCLGGRKKNNYDNHEKMLRRR